MNDLQLKSSINDLLNQTNNTSVLEAVLRFFQDALAQKEASAWHKLSQVEKQEVLDAYLESEEESLLMEKESVFNQLK
jgi:hypothetical protein